jgi:hypothetical protein
VNPEQVEVLEGRRVVLMAEIDCKLGAQRAARKRGDAEAFLAAYNEWERGWDELRKVEASLHKHDRNQRHKGPEDPIGI